VEGRRGYSYPQSSPALFKLRDHLHRSPASLFHSPASSSSSPSISWLAGRKRNRLFSSFVRNALGSCNDYAPVTSLPLGVPTAAGIDSDELAGELAFELDENLPCMNFLFTISLF